MAAEWRDGQMAEWLNGKNGSRMAGFLNGGRMAKWSNGEDGGMADGMAEWRPNGGMVKWRLNGGMIEWRNRQMARMAAKWRDF
jgi:hypothetical protein